MPERPIYFTKPDVEEKSVLDAKGIGCVTLFCGGLFGGIAGGVSHFIGGSDAGLRGIEVGLGFSGFMGGVMLGMTSSERAEAFAKEGRKKRAYVEALKSCMEAAVGFGIAGGSAGYGVANNTGAIMGGFIGMFIGAVGLSQLTFGGVERILSEREKS